MMNTDFFQILFMHLEERNYNSIYQNIMQDKEYLDATEEETELCRQFENLSLSEEQREIIWQWIAAIHAQNAAHTMVVFRMAMQYCFSLLMQLTDLR